MIYCIAELTRVLSQETEKFLKSKKYQRTEPARRKAGILAEIFCRLVIHESANIKAKMCNSLVFCLPIPLDTNAFSATSGWKDFDKNRSKFTYF